MLKNRLVKGLIVALGTLLITVILNWLNYTVFLGLFAGFLGWCAWEQTETAHQLIQKTQIEGQLHGQMRAETALLQNELKEVKSRSQLFSEQLQVEIESKTEIEARTHELLLQLQTHQASYRDHQSKISKLERELSKKQGLQQEIANRDEYIGLMQDAIDEEQSKRQQFENLVEEYSNQVQVLGAENAVLKEGLSQANRKLGAVKVDHSQLENIELEKTSGSYGLKIEYLGDLEDLPDREYKKVMGKIFALQTEPRPRDCDYLRKFISRHGKIYRIRTGDYRICYVIEESPVKQVRVLMVDNRNERIYDERLSSRLS
jgi:mRNA-degrading endonuclease RelE of RelBE toxin-antitoxin system